MGRFFGTDGVRGVANRDLTPELALRLGQAGAYMLSQKGGEKKVAIGRDTRCSGDMLEGALVAGITSMGVHVIRLGEIPTPGVAYLVGQLNCCGGVMISASHNPIADNGIKFFSPGGYKLGDEEEAELEKTLLQDEIPFHLRPVGVDVGRVFLEENAQEKYLSFLMGTISTDLTGLHLVVDTAHGAASGLAQPLFERLGARVTAIHDTPDGSRINVSCGATDTNDLKKKTIEVGANLGLALDGDADRLILVDEEGVVRDGDFIMAICGRYLKENGVLKGDTVVATAYSNMGLGRSLSEAGISLEEVENGDRYVLQRMLEKKYLLGGEQSGHIIFLAHIPTGDGLLSALKILEVMQVKKKRLSSLAQVLAKYPQILKNVRVKNKDWEGEERIVRAIKERKEQLNGEGRILVRSSGTEPVIRVMVEGRDEERIGATAHELAMIIKEVMS